VTANNYAGSISVLLGVGNGTFSAHTDRSAASGPYGAELGDLNGDGRLDLLLSHPTSNQLAIYLGAGNGSFGTPSSFATGSTPYFFGLGDANWDGRLDVAIPSFGSNTVGVAMGNGSGGFGARTDLATGTGPNAATFADEDHDGKVDYLVVIDQSAGAVSLLRGNGEGAFAPREDYSIGSTTGPVGVALGDFNEDGQADLVVPLFSTNAVAVLQTNNQGDIYAQHIDGRGVLGNVNTTAVASPRAATLALEAPWPNPVRGVTPTLRFSLPSNEPATLELYDVAGRKLETWAVSRLGAGAHAMPLATTSRLDPGLYFVRLVQGTVSRVARFAVLR